KPGVDDSASLIELGAMQLSVVTWNMDHWKGVRRDSRHTEDAWEYVAGLGADIVLLQEAVPPPAGHPALVFPPPLETARWQPRASCIRDRRCDIRSPRRVGDSERALPGRGSDRTPHANTPECVRRCEGRYRRTRGGRSEPIRDPRGAPAG